MVPRHKNKYGKGLISKRFSYYCLGWKYFAMGIKWSISWGTARNLVFGFVNHDKTYPDTADGVEILRKRYKND